MPVLLCDARTRESGKEVLVTLVREPGMHYRCTTSSAPLVTIANTQRRLPDAFIQPSSMLPSAAFVKYARPLIGDPLPALARLDLSLRP